MDAEEREWQLKQQQQQQRGTAAATAAAGGGALFTSPASRDSSAAHFESATQPASPSPPPAARQQSTTTPTTNAPTVGRNTATMPTAAATVGAAAPEAPPAAKKKKVFHGENLEYRYPSGSVYVGAFRDGKLHGYGKYIYHPSNDVYEGEWLNDMKHGKGVYTYEGGDRYTGEWRAGKKHGRGSYIFTNGDEYVGGWAEDRIHGFGVFCVARNGNRYEGQWHESYRQGMGVLHSGNGNVYEGQWLRGKEHGPGVLLYPDGKFYAGDWKAGKMDGRGILFENGNKYLVEHVGGFMVSEKAPVPEDAVLDPSYNTSNKLYHNVRRAQANRTHSALRDNCAGGDAAVAAGSKAVSDHRVERLQVENEMLRKKYEDVLNARGAPRNGFANEADPAELGADVEALRQLVRDTRSQRDVQRRRADEAKEEVLALQDAVRELEFNLDAVKKTAALDHARSGVGLDSLELQRRVADLEAQLREANASPRGSYTQSAGSSPGGAAVGAPLGGRGDVLELQAKMQLLEGENASLKKSKDELAKVRVDYTALETKLRTAEFRIADLEREMQTAHTRAQHGSQEKQQELTQRNATLTEEIRELQRQLLASRTETEAVSARHKAMIEKMRSAETKGLQAADLEAQLEMLRRSRTKEQIALERKSEELDHLKQQNATLAREVEELQALTSRTAQRTAMAAGGEGGASSDLEARLALIEKERQERDKKEKKKMKKMLTERDEAVQKLGDVSRRVNGMSMQLRCLVEYKVLTFARVVSVGRSPVSAEGSLSAPQIGADGSSIVLGNETFTVDAVFAAQPDSIDAMAAAMRDICHSVASGFNCSVVGFGAMNSGKTASLHALLPLLLRDTLEPCTARNSTHEVTVTLQAIELSCVGIADLMADGSGAVPAAAGEIRIVKDCYNSVQFSGCAHVPVSNVLAFRDVAATLQQRSAEGRKRKRSHVIYAINCTFRHRVTGACTFGKLLVADLAGMGSLGDQDADIDSARYINSSIVHVQNVISALTTAGQTAVPYRADPLTMALSDVLGGNSRTVVVAHVPAESNSEMLEHTTQALVAATKAREVVNAPIKRVETTEVTQLRRALRNLDSDAQLPSTFTDIGTIRE